nr:uncharacterized protein LOC113703139 [Coffea arabica]
MEVLCSSSVGMESLLSSAMVALLAEISTSVVKSLSCLLLVVGSRTNGITIEFPREPRQMESLTLRPRMPVKVRMMAKTMMAMRRMMAVRMRKTFLVKRRMMRMTKILRMSRRPMVMVEVGMMTMRMMTMTMKMEMERKRTMRKERMKRLPSHLLKKGNDLEGFALVLPLLQWLGKVELRLRVRVTV